LQTQSCKGFVGQLAGVRERDGHDARQKHLVNS
jgi:hypothetical protein